MKAIFITWKEEESEFVKWEHIGADYSPTPVFKTKVVTRKARWSNTVSKEMLERAEQYIKKEMQDRPTAKVVILEEN